MASINDKQVVLVKTTVSNLAKKWGIPPLVAQNEVKKLAAQLHDHDGETMSIKEVDSELFNSLIDANVTAALKSSIVE